MVDTKNDRLLVFCISISLSRSCFKKQEKTVMMEFEERLKRINVEFAELGKNIDLYWKVCLICSDVGNCLN